MMGVGYMTSFPAHPTSPDASHDASKRTIKNRSACLQLDKNGISIKINTIR
jgi:hypothetical protein